MAEITALLQALAALAWPALGFTFLIMYRNELTQLLRRMRRGKLLGQEIELSEELDLLELKAEKAERDVAALPRTVTATAPITSEPEIVRQILLEAARSPKAALLLLAGEIERITMEILAAAGRLQGRRHLPFRQAISEINTVLGALPSDTRESLDRFWTLRTQMIHGGIGSDEDILRAIDSGVVILKTLLSVPVGINIVEEIGIPLFRDEKLTVPYTDLKGIRLRIVSTAGGPEQQAIFPTTLAHYQKGQKVAGEWNFGNVIGPAWIREPKTGMPRSLWSQAAEFVGRDFSTL